MNKVFVSALFVLVTTVHMSSQTLLAPAKMGGLWGVIDEMGEWVILPKYLEIKSIVNGKVFAKDVDGWLIIDYKGTIVKKTDDNVIVRYNFRNGYCRVRVDGLWGYIDINGKQICDAKFLNARDFFDGLAAVEVDEGWGYIDTSGALVIPPVYHFAKDFRSNRALVSTGKKDFFINRLNEVIDIPYEVNGYFNFGVAFVSVGNSFGVIDTLGSFVIDPVYNGKKAPSEGIIPLRLNDRWGYSTLSGKILFEPIFNDARPFNSGVARVRFLDKWYFIDKSGKILNLNMSYFIQNDFSEGLSAVKDGGLWGYVGIEGEYIIEAQFIDAQNFCFGLAAVKLGNLWGVIDKSGQFVIAPRFEGVKKYTKLDSISDEDREDFL